MKIQRRIPEVLTSAEMEKLLDASMGKTWLQRRNHLIVRLMLNAGLRSQEVVDLRWKHLDFNTGRLKIRGKGGRERVLWLSEEDLALLQDFAGPNRREPHLIFTTRRQTALTTRYLRQLVARFSKKGGIRHLHPHLLRHSFATDLLRQTKNLRLVQKAMGHANIETTTIYTHIVDDELQDALKNLRNGG